MRLLPGAVAVLLLLMLLTWLLVHAIDTGAPAHSRMLQAFDDFALAEASLSRDALRARAGLLRNYDALNRAIGMMEDAVERLRSHAEAEGLDAGPAERLVDAIAREEELLEHFKSSNALLQNTLSYVGLLSTGPAFATHDAPLAPAAGALAAAMLNFTRDTSSDAAKLLGERIDQFAAQVPPAGRDAEAAHALLAHARLLHGLLPETDRTLSVLLTAPTRQPLSDVRTQFSEQQSVVETRVQRFELLLYATSLLLLVALVYLGLKLRARALAFRRRAAFERVIAETSTRLINCPPAESDTQLKQVLGALCRAIGAERGYVVLDENPIRVNAWCASEASYPSGWPDQALALSARLEGASPDIITVADVASMPPGDVKNVLMAAGVRSWGCVPLIRPGRARGILGFDAFLPGWNKVFPLPVVRLAGDAVANAIERNFLERDRTKLTTRLERTRRMQMIGSLASGIAHNFNNVIAAILGYSEMVEPQIAPGTKAAQHVDEIRRAAERGRDLIDNILTFGRPRDARVELVRVRALFDEAASLLRASLPTSVELTVENVPDNVAVSGNSAQLQQIILNLCTNAAQAMGRGGSIRVIAERTELADRFVLSHGELAAGRYVCLAVIDTGCGFDESSARRLFEPFYTTRPAGTGLGLATVHEIVHDHDGAMNVQSKPGQGSRFEAWLPAATVGDALGAPRSFGQGETVLILESERKRLLRDEEMLAALGYEPIGFERAEDALAACRSDPARFDVILVSDALHTRAALDLMQAMRVSAPRKPLLFATASTIDLTVDALAEAGISEVLRRPLASTELATALARCLGRDSFHAGPAAPSLCS